MTYCLLKVKLSLDCVNVVYFSDSNVRNSVFRTVSNTVSYSSRTCRTTKSSWKGLQSVWKEGTWDRVAVQACKV